MAGRARGLTVVLALAWMVIGAVHNDAAAVTDSRIIRLKPSVGDAAAHMNQGWHAPDNGVDWDDQDGDGTCCTGLSVWLRAWVYRSLPGLAIVATLRVYEQDIPNVCVRTTVAVKNYEDFSTKGYIDYRHAFANPSYAGVNLFLNADSSGELNQYVPATMQVRQESWETWDGAHVHTSSRSGAVAWSLNDGDPPNAIPYPAYGQYTYSNPPVGVTERRLDWTWG